MNNKFSRRNFFWSAADETLALVEQFRGQPSLKIPDLRGLPGSELALLIPVLREDVAMTISGKTVLLRAGDLATPIYQCAEDSRSHEILRRLDGTVTLGEIAAAIANIWAVPEAETFAEARSLFLALVDKGICLPANAPGAARRGA